MSNVSLTEVIEGLRARTVALRPPWYQPGPPNECWVLAEGSELLLVVWDAPRERALSVRVFDDAWLLAQLPRLVGRPHVPDSSVCAWSSTHDVIALRARAAASAVARTLASLRARPETSLVETHPGGASHLAYAPEIGWRSFLVSEGRIVSQRHVEERELDTRVGELLAGSEALLPTPIEPSLAASLEVGDRRFVALRHRMARGEIGWRVHQDRVVVDVDGAFFNAAFHGTRVTYSHAFLQGHVLADMLTRTLLEDEPSAVVQLLPGQQESLRASVAPR